MARDSAQKIKSRQSRSRLFQSRQIPIPIIRRDSDPDQTKNNLILKTIPIQAEKYDAMFEFCNARFFKYFLVVKISADIYIYVAADFEFQPILSSLADFEFASRFWVR